MTGGAFDVEIDRLVLDGLDLPTDQAATLGDLIETELRRIFAGGGPADGESSAGAELGPLMLATPPDVPKLVRDLAARIADAATAGEQWDA